MVSSMVTTLPSLHMVRLVLEKHTRKKIILSIVLYRMLGTEENPGNMFHTLKELFMKMKDYKLDREFKIRVSFLEIYNEQIRDLIVVSPEFLDLREDPVKGLVVAGLSEIEVRTPEEILNLLM